MWFFIQVVSTIDSEGDLVIDSVEQFSSSVQFLLHSREGIFKVLCIFFYLGFYFFYFFGSFSLHFLFKLMYFYIELRKASMHWRITALNSRELSSIGGRAFFLNIPWKWLLKLNSVEKRRLLFLYWGRIIQYWSVRVPKLSTNWTFQKL